ncbi:MAG: hypothetical protein JKY87_07470 [Mariprofundus sp.]|nr:hypothetical protein [Mariprofundus sp.]
MNNATSPAAKPIIRHPVDIPLEVKALAVAGCNQDNHAYGEFPMMIAVGALLRVRIPSINANEALHGQVIWLARSAHGFIIGMSFQTEHEAFRMRMLEQLCYIEDYRQQALDNEGRSLDAQQAATEWIEQYAAAFPSPTLGQQTTHVLKIDAGKQA